MKSYTDLEQSKKLAEILPLESADMRYHTISHYNPYPCDEIVYTMDFGKASGIDIPCWSLAALLAVLPFHLILNNQRYAFSMHKGLNKDGETYMIRYNVFNTDVCIYSTDYYNNSIDACYEMIIKLHELNLL